MKGPKDPSRRGEVEVGALAPMTSWELPDGTYTNLLRYRGTPVVLAFFSSDWDPGEAHQIQIFNDALRSLSRTAPLVQLRGNGVGLHCEVEDGESSDIPIFRGLDPNGLLARDFGVEGQVAIFVIDPDGFVRFRHTGQFGSFPNSSKLAELLTTVQTHGVSRRQFVFTAVATVAALFLIPKLPAKASGLEPQGAKTYTLHINGQDHTVPADPRITVLDALRERLGMTGTKKGCDHGQCGACTIHLNGKRVNSCLLLAAQAQGAEITTIEGIAHGERLHPVQEAFIEHDGFQCGYCTSGQIMSAVACIKEGHTKSKEEIREWMSGNICRCGAYQGILEAVEHAAGKTGGLA